PPLYDSCGETDTEMKRGLDIFGATIGLIILAPLLFAIAVAGRLSSGSPVLFPQTRIGLRGRPFTLLKFRTMRDGVRADGAMLPDSERLTRLGKLLRGTRLDALSRPGHGVL